MADISKIQIESGTYDIKDEIAREKVNKVAYNNIFVGTFFDSTNLAIHFVTSLDGQNWSEFNKGVSITGVRDPQLTYNSNNKTFYLCVTYGAPGVNFRIYTSTDFVTWTQHNIAIGISNNRVWAPELFYDGDDTYLLVSIGTEGSMQQYIYECDIENLTFSNPRILNVGLSDVIDGSMIKYNDVYYLTVKDESSATQKIFSSYDLYVWEVVNSDILGMDVECEGGQLLNINGRWYFYGDTWYNYGLYGYMQTDDITDFKYLIPNGLFGFRHGSVLYLEDREVINLITNLEDYNTIARVNEDNRLILLSGSYDKLVVIPNFNYRINATTTINELVNPYNLQFLPITFTAPRNATLTIPLGTGSTHNPVTITNSTYNNEKLMIISLQDSHFISGARIKKTIDASDLWTVNDDTEWTVTLYDSILSNNLLHLTFAITKLASTATVSPVTLKERYRPINPTEISNDKGKDVFFNTSGTITGYGRFDHNENTYCYMTFEIE